MTVKMMMMMKLMIMITASIEIARVKSSQVSKHVQTVWSITYYKLPTTSTSSDTDSRRNLNTLLMMRIEKRQIAH